MSSCSWLVSFHTKVKFNLWVINPSSGLEKLLKAILLSHLRVDSSRAGDIYLDPLKDWVISCRNRFSAENIKCQCCIRYVKQIIYVATWQLQISVEENNFLLLTGNFNFHLGEIYHLYCYLATLNFSERQIICITILHYSKWFN